jgi:hypothetical protein
MRARTVLRAAAALGVFGSVLFALFFFSYLEPLRRLEDARWLRSHSSREVCAEVVRVVDRFDYPHDATLALGRCGGEREASRLLEDPRLPSLLTRFDGHIGTALRLITNQDIPEKDSVAWRNWWQANRHLSQRAWVREGFRLGGLTLHDPLSQEDRVALLRILDPTIPRPTGWGHNAFRLLRESGFVPIRGRFVTELTASSDPALLRGLIAYERSLALEPDDVSAEAAPLFTLPRVRALVALVLLCIMLGCAAIFRITAYRGRAGAA